MTKWLEHLQSHLLPYGVAITVASAVMFLASAWLIPWFVARMPADYFQHKRHTLAQEWRDGHHVKVFLRIGKNLIGYILLMLGILMLVLPGQGLLTMLVAIILCDFPRKFEMERKLLAQPSVRKTANWLRERHGSKPFVD